LCLASDLDDLRSRLSRMVVAYDVNGNIVTADDIHAVGSMMALLKDAAKPNLIQTLEHTPALVHGGPFANIAHGCNSVRATKAALKMGDIAITEAGFGADLGAEKFLDIKCPMAGLTPDACVIVATVRALKYNGGVPKADLSSENMKALEAGIVNLRKHIENIQLYGLPVIVSLNAFDTDTENELEFVRKYCTDMGCDFALSKVWAKGGAGGEELAKAVIDTLENKKSSYKPLYDFALPIKDKIEKIATKVYGAGAVAFSDAAAKKMAELEKQGFGNLPVCMAKTQYSLSDDPALLGRPEGYTLNVRDMYVSAGAGFVVALTGNIMTMPGLPKKPAAYDIDVDKDGNIIGLF
ncbi:MAG: formate--tetrahydrofolate ligase, partial [Lachnospiraceae bacterium]|nr:formate--tetrahydrofolate ligase [Lachnospiraceae bacterium]